MKFKIYYQREFPGEPRIINLKPLTETKQSVKIVTYYQCGDVPIYGFNLIENDEIHVLSTMVLPGYFRECKAKEIHGLFLLPIGPEKEAKAFLGDLSTGSFGCPRRFKMPDTYKYFTFNNQRFYPFIMTDFSIGYYVRDEPRGGGEVPEWPDYSETDTMIEVGVGIDHPISFDATLGLYITRAAHVEFEPKEKTAKKKK